MKLASKKVCFDVKPVHNVCKYIRTNVIRFENLESRFSLGPDPTF